MNFSERERQTLEGLANVLIPACDGMPSASEAGVGREGLNLVLQARPDLAPTLHALAQAADHCSPESFVADLPARHPDWFAALTEAVPAAYFFNEEVRRALGYHGQGPIAIDPDANRQDEPLLEPVRQRGPIYRPTPPSHGP
jgi:hypothetical protein